MDEREAKIASRLTEAADKKKEAEAEAESFRSKTTDLDAQRAELMAKAKADADAHRAELMKQARAEVDALEAKWRETIGRQRAAFLQDLRQRATKQTFAVARRALADLAGADLEARILDVFVQRLEALPEGEWDALVASLPEGDDEERTLVVRSVFALPADTRQRLEQLVRQHAGDGVALRFEEAFDPVCGIELRGQGSKVAWSVEHYLNTLDEELGKALDQQVGEGTSAVGTRQSAVEEGEKKSAGSTRQEPGTRNPEPETSRQSAEAEEKIEDEDDDNEDERKDE